MFYGERLVSLHVLVLVVLEVGQLLYERAQEPEVGESLQLGGLAAGELEVEQVGGHHALLVPSVK